MKKLLTIMFSFVLAISCMVLTACKEGDDVIEGIYKIYQIQMTSSGTTVTYNLGGEAPWGGTLTEDTTMELKADGVSEGCNVIDGQEIKITGTYVINGENISITLGGQTIAGTIKNGVITASISMNEQTTTYIYKK